MNVHEQRVHMDKAPCSIGGTWYVPLNALATACSKTRVMLDHGLAIICDQDIELELGRVDRGQLNMILQSVFSDVRLTKEG